ncbi:MAG: EF-P beta-lysylation protein EpmB [Planctomycetota bacterium]
MASLSEPLPTVRPQKPTPPEASWRRELRDAVRDPAELCRLLDLPVELALRIGGPRFPLRAPRPFVARMRSGDRNDPLLRQVWPDLAEDQPPAAGYSADPVGDLASTVTPGLLHKYHGRALLIATSSCAIHCRYCFRREFPYNANTLANQGWSEPLEAIAADPTIEEVILSGGDPLTLVDETLARLVEQLESIEHVRRLRIHTRLPIVLPSRVTDGLVRTLADSRQTVITVVHANHANELDAEVAAALAKLRNASPMLLNQSVLLRGVNDSAAALADLSRRLVQLGVAPYYLHLLDKVVGAGHFAVDNQQAERLIDALRRQLPGYAVPRLAREDAGAPHKTIIA